MRDFPSLIREKGRLFSEELGIAVGREPFRWLLAAILFGRRINETIAKHTYKAFERRGLLTPRTILRAGRDNLICALGEGGYVRYDNMTADYLLAVCQKLVDEYDARIETIHVRACTSADVEAALLAFKGIGPVTVSIFLRELRGVWERADPPLTEIELLAARKLGLTRSKDGERALKTLKAWWEHNPIPGHDFRHLEAALVRTGLELRRRSRRSPRRHSETEGFSSVK